MSQEQTGPSRITTLEDKEALEELITEAKSPEDLAYLAEEEPKVFAADALAAARTKENMVTLGEKLAREDKEAREDWRLPKE